MTVISRSKVTCRPVWKSLLSMKQSMSPVTRYRLAAKRKLLRLTTYIFKTPQTICTVLVNFDALVKR